MLQKNYRRFFLRADFFVVFFLADFFAAFFLLFAAIFSPQKSIAGLFCYYFNVMQTSFIYLSHYFKVKNVLQNFF